MKKIKIYFVFQKIDQKLFGCKYIEGKQKEQIESLGTMVAIIEGA